MPDIEIVKWNSRKCLNCGYIGYDDEFAIRDLGNGVPPENCPICDRPWTMDDAATRSYSRGRSDGLLYRMYCSACRFEKYYTVELRDPAFIPISRRNKWRLSTPCEALRQVGHHQYKRFHEGGKYVNRCRSCGELQDQPSNRHQYLTSQGVIDKWLHFLGEGPFDSIDETPYDEGFDTVVSDLGFVYDCGSPEKQAASYRERASIPREELARSRVKGEKREYNPSEPPTGPLRDAGREWKRRYRRIIRYEEEKAKEEITRQIARGREGKIHALADRVSEYCKNRIPPEDLADCLTKIRRCLETFDFFVLKAQKALTDKQLEQLAAGATCRYIPELTQKEVAGTSQSIFPDVTRPTLGTWQQYVKTWDPPA